MAHICLYKYGRAEERVSSFWGLGQLPLSVGGCVCVRGRAIAVGAFGLLAHLFECLPFALQGETEAPEAAEAAGSGVGAAAAGPAPEPGPAPGVPAAGGSHGDRGLGERSEDGSNFL